MTKRQCEARDGFDLIEYPCEYMFKAVGRSSPGFEIDIRRDVASEIGESSVVRVSSMTSRKGRYISMTFVIRLESRQQLEAVYAVMAAHPDVVMTL